MGRILLAEDNGRFGALLKEHLADWGLATDLVTSIGEFHGMAAAIDYALYVVDLTLPDGDGLDLIAHLRARRSATPILVVTARAGIDARVSGLDRGADDYLVKPFHHSEFLARVRALLRRPRALAPVNVAAGNIVLDVRSGELSCAGQDLALRRSERRLLALLIERSGHIVPRSTIENELCSDFDVSPNAVEQVVCRLRKALNRQPAGITIKTIRGLGYMLEPSHAINA